MKFTKKDIEQILEDYNIGKYKSHKKLWWSLDNILLLLNTDKGKFILKFFKDSNKKYVLWTLETMERMRKKGLPAPETLKDKQKELIHDYKRRYLIIQEFIEGEEIRKFKQKLVIDFARNLGILDKYLLKTKLTGRYVWEKIGHQFEPSKYRSSNTIKSFDYKNEEEKIIEELNKNVNKEKLRASVIHSDYNSSNLIVHKAKIIGILDWNNLHEDFLVYDSAIAMAHIFRKTEMRGCQTFMSEYRKHIRLNEDEKKAVYYFIKNKLLGSIVWCDLQRKKHKEKSKLLNKWLKDSIEDYNKFNRISLKEFLRIIK